jgi:glycyl-tRNA synthetase beta chain
MTTLLLELFSEEIPARMQALALEQLRSKLEAGLREARLSYAAVRGYVTPRRLAVLVEGLPEHQSDQTLERKGPKVSAPDAAIEGFCASVGLARTQLQVRGEGKDATYFAVSEQKGLSTFSALPDIITPIISGFHWPKSMRWGDFDPAWVRPLRSILCLFGTDSVPVTWGHLRAGNHTHGHRFMAPATIAISSPEDYETALQDAYVVADADKRKVDIWQQATALAQQHGLAVLKDEGLLNEVTGLVEHPVALMGTFDAAYLRLPPEVLVLEMRHHQKYFAVLDGSGKVTNRFITIANLKASDGGARIIAGNERVIRARLEDGAFYYEQDRKKSLDSWAEGLASMMFHKRLGSVADKVARMAALAEYLVPFVQQGSMKQVDATQVQRAVALCKADLTTGMVGEFPELQGVMGRYYALAQGEDEAVADAVRDHYKPAGQGDIVPTDPISVVVALADKWDTLVGMFAAGEIPTGSKDPYALRRAALGIVRIMRENGIRMNLSDAIHHALKPFHAIATQETAAQVQHFMMERLKVALKEEGMRHDLTEAALMQGADGDVVRIAARAQALQDFLSSADGENVLAAYKRAANILKKEEAKDGRSYDGAYDREVIMQEMERTHAAYERDVVDTLAALRPKVELAVSAEDYKAALRWIATLRAPLDAFFGHVIVNADDARLRANRLQILAAMRALLHQVADFTVIAGSAE